MHLVRGWCASACTRTICVAPLRRGGRAGRACVAQVRSPQEFSTRRASRGGCQTSNGVQLGIGAEPAVRSSSSAPLLSERSTSTSEVSTFSLVLDRRSALTEAIPLKRKRCGGSIELRTSARLSRPSQRLGQLLPHCPRVGMRRSVHPQCTCSARRSVGWHAAVPPLVRAAGGRGCTPGGAAETAERHRQRPLRGWPKPNPRRGHERGRPELRLGG